MTSPEHSDIGMTERLAAISLGHARLRSAAAALTEEQARAPIALPGWTRGHVLIHLGDLSAAFARQARYAVRDKLIEVYDGGRAARDKSIDADHGRPIAWLRGRLNEGLTELEAAWWGLGAVDWERLCSYRDLPLLATQLAWWREVELHAVDLDTGYGSDQWSVPLADHVTTFLQSRLPADQAVTIHATDTGRQWQHGIGDPVVVRGEVRSIAAWISGRPHDVPPTSDAELPELSFWP